MSPAADIKSRALALQNRENLLASRDGVVTSPAVSCSFPVHEESDLYSDPIVTLYLGGVQNCLQGIGGNTGRREMFLRSYLDHNTTLILSCCSI